MIKLPYVSIESGKIKVSFNKSGKDDVTFFAANEEGAIDAGNYIRSKYVDQVKVTILFSSSVDFPTDYGAPDLDFRSLITTVNYFEVTSLSLLDLIYMSVQKSIDDGDVEGIKVSQDNDNKDGTIIFDTKNGSWILSSNDIRST